MVIEGIPYVSIVITGRNDGHGGDFVRRFLATLAFNHRELSARGVAHEFVHVEWAPIAGAPLLADVVDERCPASLAAVFRTIIVDAAYQDVLTLNPRVTYLEYVAKNVGLRRARGEYVIVTNCDIFFGRRILERLERRDLQAEVVYRAPRWDLHASMDAERLDWEDLESPANLVRPGRRLRPPYFAGATGDFIGLDRNSMERVQGFNEVYRLARVGIDGNFLVHALSSGLAIADIGGPVYHVDHEGSYQMSRAHYVGREWEAPYGDDRWHADSVVYRNREAWALRDAPDRSLGPRRIVLDFSWDAVPPLVDLGGILVPEYRHTGADDPANE
jgi:hypothetical protein